MYNNNDLYCENASRQFSFTRRVPSCRPFLCSLFHVCEFVARCETVGEGHLIRQSILIVSSNKDKREALHVCTCKAHTRA